MQKLKLLQLNFVQVNGSFVNFPKGLRWLSWQGFPFKSMNKDLSLKSMVVLDMRYSRLQKVWEETKFLDSLKILHLSNFYNLTKTPNFLNVHNLERVIFKNCARLFEVHESIGHLHRLVLLNLRDCKNLRKLPRSNGMLKFFETLDISGCSNLEELPVEMGTMESLTTLRANEISISRLVSTTKALLPRSLVDLSLEWCNLSDNDFPRNLSSLSSLQRLNLSCNPICTLPDFIRALIRLEILNLKPIENVDIEIINNLGFSTLGSIGVPNVMLSSWDWEKARKLPMQEAMFQPGSTRKYRIFNVFYYAIVY
ncbi:hypothetical protein ACSBR2_004186 [Camellia fascicularis]